jgi:flagellar L-ring protein precursor FlgH
MRKLVLFATILLSSSAAFGQVNSEDNYGSLFPGKYNSPYISRRARAVGDILTLVIDESSTATYTANTSATKKDTNAVDPTNIPIIGTILSGVRHLLRTDLLGSLYRSLTGAQSSGANSSNTGTGATSAVGKFTAKMAVTVRDVLPNGNLVIEGTRTIKINKNDQDVTFTGIVRLDDVLADNSVLSQNVADMCIVNAGKGLIADRQRRGIITRLLDWLF